MDFLDIYSGGRLGANNSRLTTNNSDGREYNIYGRIVTKTKKGCSYFFSLLNTHAKMDGWVNCSIKLENEAYNEGMSWECDEFEILTIVKQVYKTPYLNRLKQFFLCLLRNNLYIDRKNHNSSPLPLTCMICGKHPEKRISILFSCEVLSGAAS